MGFYSKCFRFEGGGRQNIGLKRTGKSCRLRWVNYLHPGLKRGKMTPHEEKLVLELHSQLGNRWSRIARRLPGRTDNEIKNYWRTHMRKKAQEQKKTSSSSSSPSSSSCVSPFSPPSSNCSSNNINDTNSDYKANNETSTTTGIPEEEVYSMDDIWKDISSSEEVIKPMSSTTEQSSNFSCPGSALWDYYSPWKMDDEESKMFNFPF